jgi:hypothetical protein
MDTMRAFRFLVLWVGFIRAVLMALARQVVPVRLQGLDQLSPKQIGITGKLDSLVNMYAQQGDQGGYEFVPRPGVTALSRTADVGSITTGMRLATLGTSLLLLTGGACYRRATDEWHSVSQTYPIVGVDSKSISTGQVQTYSCDPVYVNGFTIHVWTEFSFTVTGKAYYSVYDANGNAAITRGLLEAPGGSGTFGIRVVTSGTTAIVVWNSQLGSIKAAKIDTTNLNTAPTPVVVTAGSNQLTFDAQTVDSSGTVAVLYQGLTGRITQNLITVSSMAVGAPVDYASLTFVGTLAYLTNDFSTNVLYVALSDTTAGLRVSNFNGTTLALNSTSTFDAAATGNMINIAGNRTGGTITVYYTADSTVPTPSQPINYKIMTSTGSGSSVVVRGIQLASRVIPSGSTLYAMARYLPDSTATTGDMNYFLLDLTHALAIGEAAHDVAGFSGSAVLPNLAASSTSNKWLTAGQVVVGEGSSGGSLFAYTGANAITFTIADTSVGRGVELNGGLILPGSLPMYYDGSTLVEAGFPIPPAQAFAPTLAGGGGLTASSTYTCRFIYEWFDGAGNRHQSSPSAPQQFTLAAGQTQATFALPTLRLTRKTNVNIVFERTVSNGDGSAFFQEGIVGNDPTVDTVSFVSTIGDTALKGGEPLYTNGYILENIAPPPCRAMAIHRGRILVGGIDGDPTAVWFSKDVEPGFGIAFNDGLVSRLNSANETVTAVGSMDNYAVACTNTTTWASSDDYPDDTGNPGVLRFSQSSSVNGCASATTLARDDEGIMIWNAKKAPGPWRLDRSLNWSWVGSKDQLDAASLAPVAMLSVPGLNQVRVVGQYATNTAAALTRENVFGTWAFWQYLKYPVGGLPTFVDAIVWNGNVAYLTTDGYVTVEDTTTYGDEGTTIIHSIALSNFNFAGVAGYQRIYVSQFTGRVIGSGTGVTLIASQTPDNILLVPDKSKLVTASANGKFGLEVDPDAYGKCSSYTIGLRNAAGSGNDPLTAWTLSAVTAVVGVKPNASRLPPSFRMT